MAKINIIVLLQQAMLDQLILITVSIIWLRLVPVNPRLLQQIQKAILIIRKRCINALLLQ